jgi:indolepyruvate ferredoxin oxidoreductase
MTKHRNIERALISEYKDMINKVLNSLNNDNYNAAIKIASLPDHIRGYDVVKEASIEKTKLLKDQYFNEFKGISIDVVNKYPKVAGEQS